MTGEPAIRVFWAENDAPWPAGLEAIVAGRLPEPVAARALRYQRWQDRQARLLARLLLVEALAAAGLPADLGALTWSEHGRPCLPMPGDFNIAHSGGLVLCAWTDRGAVGIDVEQIRPVQLADYAAILSPGELAIIAQAADPAEGFMRLWTVKEAVAKASGFGLMAETLPDASARPLAFAGRLWSVTQPAMPGHALALAADEADPRQAEWRPMVLGADGGMRPDDADGPLAGRPAE